MKTLAERLDVQIEWQRTERQRVSDQYQQDLVRIDSMLDTLRTAKRAMTPAVEQAYTALVAAKIIQGV